MNKEVEAKVKAIFPEDVEGIYISKNDYDRLYGDLTLENIELKQEIERLNNLLKETSQTLSEQITKAITLKSENERLNNIIKDIETYIHLWNIEEIGEKTMLILNDILLIKNGMRNEVVRLKENK